MSHTFRSDLRSSWRNVETATKRFVLSIAPHLPYMRGAAVGDNSRAAISRLKAETRSNEGVVGPETDSRRWSSGIRGDCPGRVTSSGWRGTS